MCLFEYDEKKAMEAEREEGRAEGRAETILKLVEDTTEKTEKCGLKVKKS